MSTAVVHRLSAAEVAALRQVAQGDRYVAISPGSSGLDHDASKTLARQGLVEIYSASSAPGSIWRRARITPAGVAELDRRDGAAS